MTSSDSISPTPTPPAPAKGSKLWLAEKLRRKQSVLTYALGTVASGRLLWIISSTVRQQRRSGGGTGTGGAVKLKAPVLPVAQLAVWAVFWPAAYVGLRAGERWAERMVRESGIDRPGE
ncbi:hypothetical protein PG993_000414 [Apiospora rasikravindrae]|uniref:DUF4235 domain-containing protein n=1 Tax=Apiospora rasikravindrae TaxID=990691 RepID=A0ABR1U8H6_9PEZI